MKKYTLKVKNPSDWQEIHDTLCHSSNCECIPDREVTCSDEKLHSPTRSTYELDENEVEELRNHEKIEWIELSPTDNPEFYPKPFPTANRFASDVKIYRDLDSNAPPLTNPSIVEDKRTNWALKRVGIRTNSEFWSSTGNIAPQLGNVSYTRTGVNVDVVIQDNAILQYHPEFMKSDGTSRVLDIVLDGPFYIDPGYFVINGFTRTKSDGRTGITEESARNWWADGSNRSSQFSGIGTVVVSTSYTERNALGENKFSLTQAGFTGSHGSACAGLAAGKTMGLAFEANIWNISTIGDNTNTTTESSYDLIKIWHTNKPVNVSTGVKNPTVINGSWGYLAGFRTNEVINYKFRGSTGTFVSNGPIVDQVTAMKEGLLNRTQFGYKSWASSSRSSSTDAAGNEMMDSGVIFVVSAGNENQRLGIGTGDPDRLNYMSDTYFGTTDLRPEFPAGTVPCNHRDWMNPSGVGYDPINDFHPVICVGAMDDFVENNQSERKAFYSNNGPGIDIWAPADETLAPATYYDPDIKYQRYDNPQAYDRLFNGTSAAAPVVTGLVALYLEENPTATSEDVKTWLTTNASTVVPSTQYLNPQQDDTQTDYWTGQYNMRDSIRRIAYNPYTDTPTPIQYQSFSRLSSNIEGRPIEIFFNTDPSNDGTYYYNIEASPGYSLDDEDFVASFANSDFDISSDFDPNTLSGSFVVSNGVGLIQFTPVNDGLGEGPVLFVVNIRENSVTGNIITTTENIILNDVPEGPPLAQQQVPLRIYLKF